MFQMLSPWRTSTTVCLPRAARADARAALTAEREAAASRDKDLHSELDKGFKNLFTGLSVLFVAIAMALCGGALKPKLERKSCVLISTSAA